MWCAEDGAKLNADGWHQEFNYCLEQVFGIWEAQFTSSTSQGGENSWLDKWWPGVCSGAAKGEIAQEDNSCAEIGADVN